jgi:hypothetical protein
MNQKDIQYIKGESFSDERGSLFFNNQLDFSEIKKIYIIENITTSFVRSWQGHKIEQRWFLAASGSFEIKLVKIDNWENPADDLSVVTHQIFSNDFSILKIPPGYATSIQALEDGSKLLVMSDYGQGEVDDNYKFNSNKW